MTDKTQVIIVADEEIHSFFTHYLQEVDTQVPTETVSELWANLQDGKLSTSSQIVLLSDTLYEASQQDFEAAVATLAPAAFVAIIRFDETLEPVITERVTQLMTQTGDGTAHPFYFIDPDNPLDTLESALEAHKNRHASTSENPDFFGDEDEFGETGDTGQDYSLAEDVSEASNIGQPTPEEYVNSDVDTSRQGLVIAVTSSKGGSGKSTVSLMLGSLLSLSSQKSHEEGLTEEPLKVCVVDMDTRDGQVGFLLGQLQPTALNIRVSPSWGPDVIWNNLIQDERTGMYALLAPKSGRTADDVSPDFYRIIIQHLRTMFDIVILDTSVNYLDSLIFDVSLPESDAVIYVTNLGNQSVWGMSRWFAEVAMPTDQGGAGIDTSKIGVVVNSSTPNVGMSGTNIEVAANNAPIIGAIPLDTPAFLLASNEYRLSDMLWHETIGPAYYSIGQKIMGRKYPLAPLMEEPVESDEQEDKPMRGKPVNKAAPQKRRRFFGR